MYINILVVTDGSELAKHAVEYAAETAEKCGALEGYKGNY